MFGVPVWHEMKWNFLCFSYALGLQTVINCFQQMSEPAEKSSATAGRKRCTCYFSNLEGFKKIHFLKYFIAQTI